jgi:hypothetical protein
MRPARPTMAALSYPGKLPETPGKDSGPDGLASPGPLTSSLAGGPVPSCAPAGPTVARSRMRWPCVPLTPYAVDRRNPCPGQGRRARRSRS